MRRSRRRLAPCVSSFSSDSRCRWRSRSAAHRGPPTTRFPASGDQRSSALRPAGTPSPGYASTRTVGSTLRRHSGRTPHSGARSTAVRPSSGSRPRTRGLDACRPVSGRPAGVRAPFGPSPALGRPRGGGAPFKGTPAADGGTGRLPPCQRQTGGDAEIAPDAAGRLYFSDRLSADASPYNTAARSDDQGRTFRSTCNAVDNDSTDRPWFAVDGDPLAGGAIYLAVAIIGDDHACARDSLA